MVDVVNSKKGYRLLISVCLIGIVSPLLLLVVTHQGRSAIIDSQRDGCRRIIADRLAEIQVYEAQYKAASIIASDPFQSQKTRDARRDEAIALSSAIRDLRQRTTPEDDGTLDCNKVYPDTPLVPIIDRNGTERQNVKQGV